MDAAPFAPPPVEADLTLIAGDLSERRLRALWDDTQAAFGRPVVAIAGNHEYYHDRIDTAAPKLKAVARERGLILLDNEEIVLSGVRILGSTLWSDFRLFAGDDLRLVRSDALHCVGDRYSGRMMDFWRIRVEGDGYRCFRPKDAAELHTKAVAWLQARLEEPFDGPTVVMTHHAPSARCLPYRFRRDRYSPAYASHLDWLIERTRPDLWLWGHIHDAVPEFRIGHTRMISNPRGTGPDGFNFMFDPGLVVEV